MTKLLTCTVCDYPVGTLRSPVVRLPSRRPFSLGRRVRRVINQQTKALLYLRVVRYTTFQDGIGAMLDRGLA